MMFLSFEYILKRCVWGVGVERVNIGLNYHSYSGYDIVQLILNFGNSVPSLLSYVVTGKIF